MSVFEAYLLAVVSKWGFVAFLLGVTGSLGSVVFLTAVTKEFTEHTPEWQMKTAPVLRRSQRMLIGFSILTLVGVLMPWRSDVVKMIELTHMSSVADARLAWLEDRKGGPDGE